MKKIVLIAFCATVIIQGNAQNLSGFSTGNYSGVNGVFSNPASIADNRYRFDISLFSLNVLAANDQASFSLKNISSNFKGDSVKNQVFGKDAGPASGMFQLDFHGPSVMFSLGKK